MGQIRRVLSSLWCCYLCSVAVSAQLVWTNRLLSDVGFRHDSSLRGVVDIAISSGKEGGREGGKEGGCLYDPIVINWSIAASSIDELRIAVAIAGRDEIAIGSLMNENTSPSAPQISDIKCCINELHCIPTVANIMAMTIGNPSITVHFSEDTDTPDLSSSKRLLAALIINPPLIGQAVGTWTNERTLSISVDQAYLQDIVGAHTRGEKIEVSVRLYSENSYVEVATSGSTNGSAADVTGTGSDTAADDEDIIDATTADEADAADNSDTIDSTQYCSADDLNENGNDSNELSNKTDKKCRKNSAGFGDDRRDNRRLYRVAVIRPTEHGVTRIFAVNATSLSVVSNILEYNVRACGGELVPPLTLRRQRGSDINGKEGENPPVASIRIRGVLSLTGKDPVMIPHDTVPQMGQGSWSLSFWVRLMDAPTGAYRALFFKGIGDTQRTPSAWLLPHTSRTTIRASTEKYHDIGSDTVIDIPTSKWTFMTYVFTNYTVASVGSREKEGLMVNGQPPIPSVTHTTSTPPSTSSSTSASDSLDDKAVKYSIVAYVNGERDVDLSYSDRVMGNEGPLWLFKDPSHDGPKAFISDLSVWARSLKPHEVLGLYGSQSSARASGIDEALDLLVGGSEGEKYHSTERKDKNKERKVENEEGKSDHVAVQKEEDISIIDDENMTLWGPRGVGALFNKPQATGGASDSMVTQLLADAQAARAACDSTRSRLDLYAEAASLGSPEAMYLWGMLTGYGAEGPEIACGFSEAPSMSYTDNKNTISDQGRATAAFIRSVEGGYSRALVPLAVSLLTGVGLEGLGPPLGTNLGPHLGTNLEDTLRDVDSDPKGGTDAISGVWGDFTLSESRLHSRLSTTLAAAVQECRGMGSSQSTGTNEREGTHRRGSKDHGSEVPIGVSALCWPYYGNYRTSERGVGGRKRGRGKDGGPGVTEREAGGTGIGGGGGEETPSDPVTRLALGLLHVAAMLGGAGEAEAILAHRYHLGIALPLDIETAAQYALRASAVSSEAFHRVGGQPIMEGDRIDDNTEKEVAKGKSGNEDELIQHQIVRAAEGDVAAMIATGDLYYYGARGLPRDQALALQYYTQAAQVNDPMGLCGAAAMHLKGEGVAERNVSKAVDLYGQAAALGSVKALNGLGYIHFYGEALPKNETKAFHYFLAASDAGMDGDSFTNAAHCLANGIGVKKDESRAAVLYETAARKYGSFAGINALGRIHMEGLGVPRSAVTAMPYLTATMEIGPWAGFLRRGLDAYLNGSKRSGLSVSSLLGVSSASSYTQSMACYLFAGELGYEVSQSNAAFIARRKLTDKSLRPLPLSLPLSIPLSIPLSQFPPPHVDSTRTEDTQEYSLRNVLQFRELALSASRGNKDSFIGIGNLYYERARAANIEQSGIKSSGSDGCFSYIYEKVAGLFVSPISAKVDEIKEGVINEGGNEGILKNGEIKGVIKKADSNRDSDLTQAVWWYSRASAAGSPLGSAYVGLINHWGLGGPVNLERAARYYRHAIEKSDSTTGLIADSNTLHPQMLSLTGALLYLAEATLAHPALHPFHRCIEWSVRYLYA